MKKRSLRRSAVEDVEMTVPIDQLERRELAKAVLGEVDGLHTQFDVFQLLKKVCELFDFSAFMVLRLPEPSDMSVADCAVINNWPTGMIAGYDALQLLRTSPLVRHVRTSTIPLIMPLESRTAASRPEERDASESLFRRFGFLIGAAVPVHDPHGRRGAICFEGEREDLRYIELLELTLISIHIYERLCTISGADRHASNPLTEREKGCLSWTAEGKTSIEIAEILGLSEHTVNHYLNRAAKKLGSVNRTQAVAKALRRGWIG